MKDIFIASALSLCLCTAVFAGQIPAGQSVGSSIEGYIGEKKQADIDQRLSTPKMITPGLDAKEIGALPDKIESIYISKIIAQQDDAAKDAVRGSELNDIITNYANKSLSLKDMKMLADDIAKRLASYGVTAYIPQQSFDNGILYINIIRRRNVQGKD